VKDAFGVYVVYDAALEDLKAVEAEIVRLASHYIARLESAEAMSGSIDRASVLLDALESEVLFCEAKRKVLDVYLEAYEHACDPQAMGTFAGVASALLTLRPRFDMKACLCVCCSV
jgi:hypothetical protein